MKVAIALFIAAFVGALHLHRRGVTPEQLQTWLTPNVFAPAASVAVLVVALLGTFLLFRLAIAIWKHVQRRSTAPAADPHQRKVLFASQLAGLSVLHCSCTRT
jgi:hypothetical protein